MNKTLIAVFGHYDSRGGTTGMPIKEATPEAVREAMRSYDRDVFGIEEVGDQITHTAYGMEARECDKIAHDLIHGDNKPSTEDFMYVAELHHPDGASLEGDLEEPDEDGRYRRVLATGTENEERPNYPDWPNLRTKTHTYQYPHMKEPESYEIPELDSLIEESCKKPVQLELVVLSARFRDTWKARIGQLDAASDEIRKRIGVTKGAAYWDDPEYRKLSEERGELWEKLQADREKEVCRKAKVIPSPVTCRWDDDAYGFIIGS